MPKPKKTTLIDGGNIACNKICQAIKEKGLPHNSIWLYINHLVRNVDSDPNLNEHQRQTIIDLLDEYLGIIKDLSNPVLIHKQGLHFLAEITEIQQKKVRDQVKEEQHFSVGLLNAISKNLEKFYTTMHDQNASDTIIRFKNETLRAIQKTKDKATMLALVEEGFDKVGKAVAHNMDIIKHSLDSMLDLESKAIIDPLTGIYNRRFFDQELPKIARTFLDLKGQKPFAMLVIDIDNFKEVNDQYGHFVGDFAIQRVAEILQKNCRAGIDAPIRLGGDEFALFLIGAAQSVATHKAQTIREQIAAESFKFTKQDDAGVARTIAFPLTVSIGVSELDYDWKDGDFSRTSKTGTLEPYERLTGKIAESADQALYDAKNQGKNKVSIYKNEK